MYYVVVVSSSSIFFFLYRIQENRTALLRATESSPASPRGEKFAKISVAWSSNGSNFTDGLRHTHCYFTILLSPNGRRQCSSQQVHHTM